MDRRTISAGRILVNPGHGPALRDAAIVCRGAEIEAVETGSAIPAGAAPLLAMPPLANAHDHLRGVRPAALGAVDLPFELWTSAASGAPPADPALVASVALGRAALGGAGAVMVHYTRAQGTADPVEEAAQVCEAARRIGVRIAFAVALRDRHNLAYGEDEGILALLDPEDRAVVRQNLARPALPPREAVARVEAIARRCSGPLIDVQFGPVGVQWCSQDLLTLIAEASAASGRRIHMHLLETRYQREWADAAYPQGMIRYLDTIGLLSPRLAVAHAVWTRPDELELLAERGVTICTNPSSNLHLRSGTAPVGAFLKARVPVALGIDGLSMDDDDDAFRELRLAYMLHKGIGFDAGVAAGDLVHGAIATGRRVVTGDTGPATLATGRPADVLLLRYDDLARDVIAEDVDPLTLILARATARAVEGLVVAGRDVVKGGYLQALDLAAAEAELAKQVACGAERFRDWQRTASRMRQRLGRYYLDRLHTCH